MAIKTMDDIEREKNYEKRKKMVSDISEDVNDVLGNVLGKKKKEKLSWLQIIIRILLFILLGIIAINIVLGNIWLLRFFIKSLFNI